MRAAGERIPLRLRLSTLAFLTARQLLKALVKFFRQLPSAVALGKFWRVF